MQLVFYLNTKFYQHLTFDQILCQFDSAVHSLCVAFSGGELSRNFCEMLKSQKVSIVLENVSLLWFWIFLIGILELFQIYGCVQHTILSEDRSLKLIWDANYTQSIHTFPKLWVLGVCAEITHGTENTCGGRECTESVCGKGRS